MKRRGALVMVAAMIAAIIGVLPARGADPCAAHVINVIQVAKSCGYHIALNDLPLVFRYNNSGAPANLRPSSGAVVIAAARSSMETWDRPWPIKQGMDCSALCYGGATTRIAGVKDGFNVIQFGDPSECAGSHGVAVACSWYGSSSRIVEVDIILDATQSWKQFGSPSDLVWGEVVGATGSSGGDALDLQSTITHELGHALGLEDLGTGNYPSDISEAPQAQQTMYGELVPLATNKRTLAEGDLAGLLYQANLSLYD